METLRKRGQRIPLLEKKPQVFDDLEPVWNAFHALHRQRPVGWSAEPLAVRDVLACLDLYGFEGGDRLDAFELICAMDAVWLDHVRERSRNGRRSKSASRD